MARCGICGVEVDHKELWKHQWDAHPEEMRARSEKGRPSYKRGHKGGGQDGSKDDKGGDKGGPTRPVETKRAAPLTPVHAALVQFVSQTFVVPNTPALTYGFLCARKFGFEGDMALFLQEVIDDFYARRDVNYYQEVMAWEGIGEAIEQLREPSSRTN